MSDIGNLNAHYTSDTKISARKPAVAVSPEKLPKMHLYNDNDAKIRLRSIDNEIRKSYKEEKNKEKKNFIKFVSLVALTILTFLGLRNFFKKS